MGRKIGARYLPEIRPLRKPNRKERTTPSGALRSAAKESKMVLPDIPSELISKIPRVPIFEKSGSSVAATVGRG
jgi:hypothetical protein